jgi:tetratricopeptide (TPR) repeat protein
MFRRYFVSALVTGVILAAAISSHAQTGQLRGHIIIKQADGTSVPASEAIIDVFRTDLSGTYNTKANKKGEFVFAGLPFVGTYVIAASHPSAAPSWLPNVRAGQDIDYEVTLTPGDGKKLTYDQIKAAMAGGGGSRASTGGSAKPAAGESKEDKAKREEIDRKNAEIVEKNKKIEEANATVARTFKSGNEALIAAGELTKAKKHEEAIAKYTESINAYNEGLAADADQSALLTNKALALKGRGVERYNTAIQNKDDAAKTAGLETAKNDFREGAETTAKALEVLKKDAPAATDPQAQARYNSNKLNALSTRAESMRLFVTKVQPDQADAGALAYQEYIAAETDPIKKEKAQHDLAQMLFDAGSLDKSLEEYKKILGEKPDDTDALVKSGMILFNIGAINNDKTKYQEAANYLQQFVDKAPDTDPFKDDAKAILEELKNQQNVKAEKMAPAPKRRTKP